MFRTSLVVSVFTFALLFLGTSSRFLFGTGANDWGNVGTGRSGKRYVFTRINAGAFRDLVIDDVWCDGLNTFVVSGGRVYGWGTGNIGVTNTASPYLPAGPIPNLFNVVTGQSYSGNTLFLLANGTLAGLGPNTYYEMGSGGPFTVLRMLNLGPAFIGNRVVHFDMNLGCSFIVDDLGNLYGSGTLGSYDLFLDGILVRSTFTRLNFTSTVLEGYNVTKVGITNQNVMVATTQNQMAGWGNNAWDSFAMETKM